MAGSVERGGLIIGALALGSFGVADAVNVVARAVGYGDSDRRVVTTDVTSRPELDMDGGSMIGRPEDPLVPCMVDPDGVVPGECPPSSVGSTELGKDKLSGGAQNDNKKLGVCGITVMCEAPIQ
jgi:hypothetical protein